MHWINRNLCSLFFDTTKDLRGVSASRFGDEPFRSLLANRGRACGQGIALQSIDPEDLLAFLGAVFQRVRHLFRGRGGIDLEADIVYDHLIPEGDRMLISCDFHPDLIDAIFRGFFAIALGR